VQGAQELGVELDAHVAFVIAAMQANAAALGLEGNRTPQAGLAMPAGAADAGERAATSP
jgi:hypothetical protein